MSTIGPMRHEITVGQVVETDDGLGGATTSLSTVATVFAALDHKSTAGAVGPGGQVMDASQIDFKIRQIGAESVRQGMQIAHDGRTFYIQAVQNEDERGRFLRLVTVERERG